MSRQTLLEKISSTLGAFHSGSLEQNAIGLFETLGYRSSRRLAGLQLSADNLAEAFGSPQSLRPEKALAEDWQSIHLLFQLTDEEISSAGRDPQLHMVFDSASKVDPTIFRSYLFFAVALKGEAYTRGQLAGITREINRLFPMPVMVLFQHGQTLTLAIIHRRPQKKETEKDVLEKVTLIKDIRQANPHRAHLEILADLALDELYEKHRFTNFLELHKAWQETLNISELNKRFFKELSNWYFWAVKKVVFPAGAGAEVESRNAVNVIRLITRLIFVWFIKEKGLVNEALFDEKRMSEHLNHIDLQDCTYYKAILQNLFFATLNTEMGEERKFRGKNEQGFDQHYMIHNVYRYESYFKEPQTALKLFEEIPFLNGGLFECLDHPDPDNPKTIVRVDGFSDRPDNPLCVPDELFFGGEQVIDLNEAYGTHNKQYKVRGLVKIFESYKFTIEENTPIEEEIALDPELLGKVFENLLAAYNPETGTTARKQTGSFYTPREIVNYMVDEALIAYLETALSSERSEGGDNALLDRLRLLLSYEETPHNFSEFEVTRLIEAIDSVKVLDPACGSGAFPMGMLHKLVYILGKLDPHNEGWKEKQIAKASEIQDALAREAAIQSIEQVFENNYDDYGRKLYLIENCIYGVDIQPIAVQIAKLRFFISLVVEQKVESSQSNLGIRPLPNLETKFVAANTLIGIERGKEEKAGEKTKADPRLVAKEAELRDTLRQFFLARSPATQERWRTQGDELCQEINQLLEKSHATRRLDSNALFNLAVNYEYALGQLTSLPKAGQPKALLLTSPEIQRLENELGRVRREHFSARTPATKRKYREIDARLRTELAELLKKSGWGGESAAQLASWDPYDQNASAGFFDPEWMFGNKDGFDIVVANPPYVDSELMTRIFPDLRDTCVDIFLSAKGNWDLFVIFIEKGLHLIRNEGILTYIVPNKLIGASYAENIKKLMLGYSIIEIRDYSKVDVFKDVDVYPITFVLANSKNKTNVSTKIMGDLFLSKINNSIPAASFYTDVFWDKWFVPSEVLAIVLKCNTFPRLDQFLSVASAATVSDAYEIKKIVREYNSGLVKPFKILVV